MHRSDSRHGVLRHAFILTSLTVAAAIACGPRNPPGSGGTGGSAGSGGSSGSGGNSGSGGSGGSRTGQLPCAVSQILRANCQRCHGTSTTFGAPMPLVTLAHLEAIRPGGPVAQLMLNRIADDRSPMPPTPYARLSMGDIATLRNWVQSGMPGGPAGEACADIGSDAGGIVNQGPTFPSDCQQRYTLRAHGGGAGDTSPFAVPTNGDRGNKLMCFYFKPPYPAGSQTLHFESVFDRSNLKYLHHWILWGRDKATHAPGTSAPCNANEANAYLINGWAPGANPLPLPPDVAVRLPPPEGELFIEIHYYNANNDAGQQDATGVEFCTAPADTRPHLAGISMTGTEGICIEPYSSKEVAGECVPRTDKGDIHIVGLFPHMHQLGRHMRVEINRANGTQEVLHDAPFSFESQTFYPKVAVLRPGDTMATRCRYDNPTANRIPFGQVTSAEMCVGFTWAWPVEALENRDGSGSLAAAVLHRCERPFDILQSCNGVLDAPRTIP
jgi:hypothetical protein